MEAKLIKAKQSGEYLLKMEGVGYIATYESTLPYKLSLKNCQAIELGYDLDELISDIVKTIVPDDRGKDIWYGTSMAVGKQCFQKALEVNDDKRFTLKEMVECWNRALEFQTHKETLGEYIKSLKQNEWDVEIVEQCLDSTCDGINRKGECITTGKPKLDADGCLILRKI